MENKTQAVLGYAALGLFFGLILFLAVYLWSTRSRTAELEDFTWVAIYMAALLGPALIGGLYGANRPLEPPAA